MPEIIFTPDSNKEEFNASALEYRNLWETEGEKITQVLEKISGFNFREDRIEARIYGGVSKSHPLLLRASTPQKRATLVHELGHILGKASGISVLRGADFGLNIHKVIFLYLYDVWEELWGTEFAKKAVAGEIKFGSKDVYKKVGTGLWQ